MYTMIMLRSYSTTLLMVPSYSMGFLMGMFYCIQLVSGLLLGSNYMASMSQSFKYMNSLMVSDLEFGEMLSMLHSNGAAFMMCMVYFHMMKVYWHNNIWSSMYCVGSILFLLTALMCFSGYCLVTGQLSLWAIVVMCNLVTAMPMLGKDMLSLIWGGTNITDITIKSMFMLHYLVGIVVMIVMVMHMYLLHQLNSTGYFYTMVNKSDSQNMM